MTMQSDLKGVSAEPARAVSVVKPRWKLGDLAPYAFISPYLLLTAAFMIYPLINAFILASIRPTALPRAPSWAWITSVICSPTPCFTRR